MKYDHSTRIFSDKENLVLSVIGAGLPRTGTLSLKYALEILGVGPCHHMSEFFGHPERWPSWEQAAYGSSIEWGDVFDGYASTADAPACWFYKEIADYYVEAKIILTVREADAWLRSVEATVFSRRYATMLATSPAHRVTTLVGQRLYQLTSVTAPDSPSSYPQHARAIFNAHNQKVQKSFPPTRLLVYSVDKGWAPLCEFLDRPIPSIPFPHMNKKDEFFEWAGSFTRPAMPVSS